MDGTISTLVDTWIDELNQTHNTHVLITDIKDYEIEKAFPLLTKEQIYKPLCSDDFWRKVKPIPNSQKYLKKIIDDGNKGKIVTATHYASYKVKVEWILEYFPFIHWKDIIVAHDKSMIKGDYLIDDCYDNLIGGDWKKICFNQPWNEKYDDKKHDVIRVHDWKEIYELSKSIHTSCVYNKLNVDSGCFKCINCNDDHGHPICRMGVKN